MLLAWQSHMNKQELKRWSVNCMKLRINCKINSVCISILDFGSWWVHSVVAIREGHWDTFVWSLLAFSVTPLYSESAVHLVLSGSIMSDKIPRPLAGCPCLMVWTVDKTAANLFFNGDRSGAKNFDLTFYKSKKGSKCRWVADGAHGGAVVSWLDQWSCGPWGRKDRRYALRVKGFRDQIMRVTHVHVDHLHGCIYFYSSHLKELLHRSASVQRHLQSKSVRAVQACQILVRYIHEPDTYMSHLKL